jgi:hypothetical protein
VKCAPINYPKEWGRKGEHGLEPESWLFGALGIYKWGVISIIFSTFVKMMILLIISALISFVQSSPDWNYQGKEGGRESWYPN